MGTKIKIGAAKHNEIWKPYGIDCTYKNISNIGALRNTYNFPMSQYQGDKRNEKLACNMEGGFSIAAKK